MSDGTLRALGILVAMFQCRDLPPGSAIPLVAIEEPEANLHPGAAEVLMDAMTEASGFTQVLATTHSPDFLDYPDLDPESLLVFDAASGETIVDTADDVSKSAIRDKLYSAGELMRMQQLRPRSLQTPTSPARASE
jgi:predicted ATPase